MKRLLFLAHRIPYPPDKGDKIRSYREWKALVNEFDVTLACFIDDPADEAHLPYLREHFREVIAVPLKPLPAKFRSLAGLLGDKPLSLAYYADSTMRRLVTEAAARTPFDVVWVFSSQVAPYADCAPNARRILDLCDLDSEKWLQFAGVSRPPKSWLYSIEGKRLGRYEVELAGRFDATVLVSPAEVRTLSQRCPGARIEVVPNGVDLDFLDPAPFDGVVVDPQTCCFCGYMDYLSNIDAVKFFHDDVLPLVRREMPGARFKIIGANPAPEVLRLAETEGVCVTGRVEDVRPELLSAAVSVSSLRLGRGVPNKILEALGLAMPVVTTSNGAAGLNLSEFPGVDVADEPAEFASAVVRRLKDAQEGRVRYPEHRVLLQEHYSWPSAEAAFLKLARGES